ncbi:MAG: DUF2796 domain-containing protein [Oleispira antarctica]|nr:DUF2796 domain-containing protein [Oleispira antarctica]MBQ0792946.1 DUF2796 domain-containing protein [Oleispira antarctica]
MRQFFQKLASVSLVLAMSTAAFGNEATEHSEHSEHSESLSPHIHGKAELQIVLEDNQLSVELNSPAMNLLGFEHGIRNAKDQLVVETVRARLENPNDLFFFNDGGCVLEPQSADFSDLLITHKNVQANHEHHENHKQDNNSHNDIKATYLYHCDKPSNLHSALIRLSAIFPNITSLHVQWIIHNRQGVTTLSHEHNEINFR